MTKRKTPPAGIHALLPAALLFSATALAAAEVETLAPAPLTDSTGEAIEEIEVIRQRPLISLRFEMNRAEDHMFELFNAFNSSDDFDVTCEEQIRVLSHIKQRVCSRRYMENAQIQNVQDFLNSGIPLKSEQQLWTENQNNHEQFSTELKTAAEQNPDVAAAVVDVVETRQRYASERKRRFEDHPLSALVGDLQD